MAQTPGNRPASVAYDRRLEPLRRRILTSVHDAIEQYTAAERSERSFDFLAQLARFRSAFTRGDLALASLLRNYDEAREHTAKQRLADARRISREIEVATRVHTSGDLRDLLEYGLEEFVAYEIQVQEVIALRRSAAWNVAKLLYVQEAQPLVIQARAIAGELAESQARATAEGAELLTRASYVVIAMALAMGLLSAGSLFVSYRLEKQVHDVVARAKRLGQYEIEERVGMGGMGEVYLARHAMLRRPTAIKLLRAESAQDLRAQSRFQREVQLTCQLTHPNTIEIFDYGRTPQGVFYYAMEYLDGFTLEALVSLAGPSILRGSSTSCSRPAALFRKPMIAGSSTATSSLSSNIMLTTKGGVPDTVKILDFGLVKDLAGGDADAEGEGEAIAGTPMYLAPEVILSADGSSPRTDLYALGAVGYFMLAGTTVFPYGDVVEILAHQINDLAPFPSERLGRALPRDLEYVILSCLAKDPDERPESAARLAEMLRACECGSWTTDEAHFWWEEYGEAARNQLVVDDTRGSGFRSELEVVVEGSRG